MLLAEHFVRSICRRHGRPLLLLTELEKKHLENYNWPGNVRELRNACEYAVIVAKGRNLSFSFLTVNKGKENKEVPAATDKPVLTETEIRGIERDNLLVAMEKTSWQIEGPGGAAELLQLRPSTLRSRLKSYSLIRPDSEFLHVKG